MERKNKYLTTAILATILMFSAILQSNIIPINSSEYETSQVSMTITDPVGDLTYLETGGPVPSGEYLGMIDVIECVAELKTNTLKFSLTVNGAITATGQTTYWSFLMDRNNNRGDNYIEFPYENIDMAFTVMLSVTDDWMILKEVYDVELDDWIPEYTNASLTKDTNTLCVSIPLEELPDLGYMLPWKVITQALDGYAIVDFTPDEGLAYLFITAPEPTVTEITFSQFDWFGPDGSLAQANSLYGQMSWSYDPNPNNTYYLNVNVALTSDGPTSWVIQNLPLFAVDNDDFSTRHEGAYFNLAELGLSAGTDLSQIYYSVTVDNMIRTTDPGPAYTFAAVQTLEHRATDSPDESPDPGPFVDPGEPEGVKLDSVAVKQNKARDVKGVQEDDNKCCAGAFARSIDWLNREYKLGMNKNAQEIYNDLVAKGVSQPGLGGPNSRDEWIERKNKYVNEQTGYKVVTKVWERTANTVDDTEGVDQETGDFAEWLNREIKKGDVEVAYTFPGSAHTVTVLEVYTQDGDTYVKYRTDRKQNDPNRGDGEGGAQYPAVKHAKIYKKDGKYHFGSDRNTIYFAVSERVIESFFEFAEHVSKQISVDPAWAFDEDSCEPIANVYEPLVRFGQINPRDVFDAFVPCLATDWTISDDGLTYDFKLRENVPWHDPTYGFVTAEDVEYSFERAMVHDKDPAWLLYEPLLGTYGADVTNPEQSKAIDDAVTVDGDIVSFHLKRPDTPDASYTPFIRILAQPVCSAIVCKQWCIDQGDWPGTWDNWVDYHNLGVSPLDDPEPVMMGTGPYMLDYWDKGVEYSLIKFDDYWGDWPAPGSRGYVERVTVQFVDDWAVRRDGFLAGVYDIVDVPRENMSEVFCKPEINCIYPLWPLLVNSLLFKYQISSTSPFLGPGFDPAGPYAFGEDRIRVDFFSDIDVRKAFAHSFDGTTFIQEYFLCEAKERPTPVIPDLPYYNSSIPIFEFNLTKAEEYFKRAWGGKLWEQGFTFTIPYLGLWRGKVCEIIKANVESLNPIFHIECLEITWSTYINQLINCELPIFMMEWCADYPDPNNLVHTFMHSGGSFASDQRIQYGDSLRKQISPYGDPTKVINNTYVDALIKAGLETLDGPERGRIYNELQQIYHEECLSMFLVQPIHRHFERTWVNGWYFNRETCGHYLYFYTMWKEELPIEDINEDGSVNIVDIGIAASAFGSDYRLCADIHPRWYSRADINCDQIVNIVDISTIALKFGYAAPPWTPPA